MLLALVLTFLITTLLGYIIHRALHQPWSGQLYERHQIHHSKLYPPSDYFSDVYRDPSIASTVRPFVLASIPVLAVPVSLGVFGVVAWWVAVSMVIEMTVIGWAHDYLHDSMHLTNHPLNRFAAFRRWNARHLIHHQDQSKNYGVFVYGWDRIFGTFVDAKTTEEKHI